VQERDRIRARRLAIAVLAVLCAGVVVWVRPALAAPLPAGFDEVDVATGFERPTSVVWAPDGRMFVSEQFGRVRVVEPGSTTPELVLDISRQVNSLGDRGLMSIALDRDFTQNGWLYLLYVKEMAPLQPDRTVPAVSVLTRVQVTPASTVTGGETVILGKDGTSLCPIEPDGSKDCIPSDFHWHAVGTVRTDPTDGTLWVSVGDSKDPKDKGDVTMRRPQDPDSPLGKVLHVDRQGRGLPGHAFCPEVTDLEQVCTKVHARGFRNPFRFHLRPGGKGPVVGDVGDNTREEVDLVRKGGSYGWPCYEGTIRHPSYQNLPYCQEEVYPAGGQLPPLWDYPHQSMIGDSITVGPVYTGGAYPDEYAGDIFIADYGQGWIKRLEIDAQDRLVGVGPTEFVSPWCCAVDLALTPEGELATVGIGINQGEGPAKIRRFTYDDQGNRAPVARAIASPATGPPRTVTFDASGSSDADGDPLTYSWRFEDGTTATGKIVTRAYAAPGVHEVQLRVHDGTDRAPSLATVTVSVGARPTGRILAPGDGALFRAGQQVPLRGAGSDPDGGRLLYSWEVRLIHLGHAHSDFKTDFSFDPDASFTAAADHDADAYHEIRLTVRDPEGLTHTTLVDLRPETRRVTLASSPAGAPLQYFPSAAKPAPFAVDALVGYRPTIGASTTFVKDGVTYRFTGWSDGGAQQHDITVPAAATTLTARYCPTAPGAPDRCAGAPEGQGVAGSGSGTGSGAETGGVQGSGSETGGGTGSSSGSAGDARPGGSTGTADRTRPVLRGLRLDRGTFSDSTRVRFSLSEAARVRIAVQRASSGRRAGGRGRCVVPGRAPRTAARCTRWTTVAGAVERTLAAGARSLRLSATFAGRRLRPGRHRLALVATDAAGNRSATARATFTVRR